MNEVEKNDKEMVKEEEGFTEVNEKEIRFHLDAYRAGDISGDDLAQAIEEIVFGSVKAPGMKEADKPGYNSDGTPKSDAEMDDDERENFYLDLDDVREHFNRFK